MRNGSNSDHPQAIVSSQGHVIEYVEPEIVVQATRLDILEDAFATPGVVCLLYPRVRCGRGNPADAGCKFAYRHKHVHV